MDMQIVLLLPLIMQTSPFTIAMLKQWIPCLDKKVQNKLITSLQYV